MPERGGPATADKRGRVGAKDGATEWIHWQSGLLRMTTPAKLTDAGVDLEAAPAVLAAARMAVADGVLGYALLISEKPR
ncbi:hypothetical protein [Streptomyces dysideae]|uniref:Uncharacterized protein n=1 Tax=Streptomyces dysideae TaxID=909626 RepID=A0A101UVC2_9ACTN|nr:hypothetical protein [Streptomyces dysideae]KUO17563.1 hypothetical protein AQJ91_29650 [Streptomyces dysideae]